jgi:AbrB family looped-hinge helix DNA binding protein
MLASTITRKGQITIPKEIRDRLGVKRGEKVIFVSRGDEIVLKVIRGTILDLRGSVRPKSHPEDFSAIRKSVRQAMSKRIAGD